MAHCVLKSSSVAWCEVTVQRRGERVWVFCRDQGLNLVEGAWWQPAPTAGSVWPLHRGAWDAKATFAKQNSLDLHISPGETVTRHLGCSAPPRSPDLFHTGLLGALRRFYSSAVLRAAQTRTEKRVRSDRGAMSGGSREAAAAGGYRKDRPPAPPLRALGCPLAPGPAGTPRPPALPHVRTGHAHHSPAPRAAPPLHLTTPPAQRPQPALLRTRRSRPPRAPGAPRKVGPPRPPDRGRGRGRGWRMGGGE